MGEQGRGDAPRVTIEQAQQWLGELFAPWVQALGLRVTRIEPGEAELLMPFSPQLCRVGGTVCGQSLMAAADTAMVFAIASGLGGFRPMTTVNQTTGFLRAIADSDVRIVARVLKPGRTLTFGEVSMFSAADGKLAAQVTTTYAML
ncbi:PaaI family thioesterase [Burkholderiaceae bacterium FT117]|uniref:PaaI family thioesterase n=1 Tax=Zeimonas sediminis TaxID=2944268 RepID=UPI002342E9D5|nr:PaaI family thioesterase [Zeimonas sediminis]MCM5571208.1 PaaI family thioesterase [Zeimonas sediminis]